MKPLPVAQGNDTCTSIDRFDPQVITVDLEIVLRLCMQLSLSFPASQTKPLNRDLDNIFIDMASRLAYPGRTSL